MSDAPGSQTPSHGGPLSHEGAWTEDAYLALEPAGRRIELIDGSLLVGPTPDDRHARAVAAVRAAVQAALPEGLEVSGPVALRLAPGRILVPDLVVAARSDSASGDVRDSSVALLVVDVVGVGNGVADRWFKPQLHAGSRIPYALLVDHDAPFAVGSMLISGRYHEYAAAEGDGVLRLEEPFALELDLTALVAAPPAGTPDSSGSGTRGPDDGGPDDGGPDDGGPDDGGPDDGGPDDGGPDDGGPDDGGVGGGSRGADPDAGPPDPGPGPGAADDGAGPEPGRNGSSTADDRSHPDEDHPVHA